MKTKLSYSFSMFAYKNKTKQIKKQQQVKAFLTL